MSIYNKLALADSSSNYLLSLMGELLMVLDNSSLNMQQLNAILKERNYTAKFRLFLLNNDETINYEIPQEDIILNSGNYTENYQQGQRRNLTINLINKDKKYTPNINTIWVQTRFRFDVGIEYHEETYWFPRGIFLMSNPTATHQDSDKQVTLSLVDKFAIFEGKAGTLEATYEIPVNTDIEKAINGILTLDNGSGYPLDLKPIVYDSTFKGMKTPYTLTKDAGGTLSELLMDLATMLNAEMYYNSTGNLCFINANETIDDTNKPSLYDYKDTETEYLSSTASYDFDNAINEVQVVGDNINNELFSAMSKNINPNSPICQQRIGRRIEYINDSNIYSDQLAQDRANYELRKNGILKTTMNINLKFNPLLLVNNLITLDDSFFDIEHQRFLIQSISYNIGDDNQISLTVSNLQNFIDVTLYELYKSMKKNSQLIPLSYGYNLSGQTLFFNLFYYNFINLDSESRTIFTVYNEQFGRNLSLKYIKTKISDSYTEEKLILETIINNEVSDVIIWNTENVDTGISLLHYSEFTLPSNYGNIIYISDSSPLLKHIFLEYQSDDNVPCTNPSQAEVLLNYKYGDAYFYWDFKGLLGTRYYFEAYNFHPHYIGTYFVETTNSVCSRTLEECFIENNDYAIEFLQNYIGGIGNYASYLNFSIIETVDNFYEFKLEDTHPMHSSDILYKGSLKKNGSIYADEEYQWTPLTSVWEAKEIASSYFLQNYDEENYRLNENGCAVVGKLGVESDGYEYFISRRSTTARVEGFYVSLVGGDVTPI